MCSSSQSRRPAALGARFIAVLAILSLAHVTHPAAAQQPEPIRVEFEVPPELGPPPQELRDKLMATLVDRFDFWKFEWTNGATNVLPKITIKLVGDPDTGYGLYAELQTAGGLRKQWDAGADNVIPAQEANRTANPAQLLQQFSSRIASSFQRKLVWPKEDEIKAVLQANVPIYSKLPKQAAAIPFHKLPIDGNKHPALVRSEFRLQCKRGNVLVMLYSVGTGSDDAEGGTPAVRIWHHHWEEPPQPQVAVDQRLSQLPDLEFEFVFLERLIARSIPGGTTPPPPGDRPTTPSIAPEP
jgi:hypothetical protein